MKHKINIQYGKSLTASTLLIPIGLLDYFRIQERIFGGIGNLFHYIVNTRHPVYRLKPRYTTGKILYQPQGLNLQRIDFFPDSDDWEKFRSFSYAQRVSMTLLFVRLLLEWDKFETCGGVVPKIPEEIQFKLSLTIYETFTYLELEHLVL